MNFVFGQSDLIVVAPQTHMQTLTDRTKGEKVRAHVEEHRQNAQHAFPFAIPSTSIRLFIDQMRLRFAGEELIPVTWFPARRPDRDGL